jgi:hypothetical protein
MRLSGRKATVAVAVALALVVVSGAGGYVAARFVTLRSGDRALFLPGGWFCNNHGASIQCQSGDAFPYVDLTGIDCPGRKLVGCGVAVRVHALRDPQGGTVTRTYEKGRPVYIFTAF